MSAAGFTPIQLYYSTTASQAPSAGNLANGELAINITDGRLFYKDNGGVVQVLATKGAGTIGGSNTQVQYNNAGALAGSANLTFDGTTLTANALTVSNAVTLSGGTANGVPYLNASKVLTSGSALTFDGTTLANSTSGTPLSLNRTGAGTAMLELKQSGVVGSYLGTSGSNDMIFFSGAAAELMRLTSTGLGIGTSSPGAKLDVNGAIRAAGIISATVGGATAKFDVNLGVTYLGTTTNQPLVFLTNNSGVAQLDTSGNLGLGVTPSAWNSAHRVLDIGSFGSLDNEPAINGINLVCNGYYSTGNQWIYKNAAGASLLRLNDGGFKFFTATSGTAGAAITLNQAMTLDASGNLGVGTTSPGSFGAGYITCQVTGTSGAGIFRATSTSVDVRFQADQAVSAGLINVASNHPLVFNTNATERARIDSSGNLLVGTTSISFTSGGHGILAGSASQQYIGHASGVASGEGYLAFQYAGSNIGTITQNGTTAVAYNTSSDYRLKNITGPITTSGAYIDSLNPVEGTWKADGSTFVGLIAHEVQEASRTQVATGVKDGEQMQGMDYSSAEIIANLIAEVKALRTRVAALEAA